MFPFACRVDSVNRINISVHRTDATLLAINTDSGNVGSIL